MSTSSGRPPSAASLASVATMTTFPIPTRSITFGESCWFPRPKTKPWPPTGVTTSVIGVRELEQPPLVRVSSARIRRPARRPRPGASCRVRASHRGAGRRSRADEAGRVVEHGCREGARDRLLGALLAGGAARLAALDTCRFGRHTEIAVEAGETDPARRASSSTSMTSASAAASLSRPRRHRHLTPPRAGSPRTRRSAS